MGSTALIRDGESVLLDSVALIYYLEANSTYGVLATEMVTRVVKGRIPATMSTVALPEVAAREYRLSVRQGQALHRQLMTMPNVEWVNVSPAITNEAARLRAEHNLRTPDALHVATALNEGVEWLVTNDPRLKRVEAEGVRVWLFDEHV